MDVEKGRSYFQRLLPAHNGGIQESLKDIVGARFRRGKQLLDIGWCLGTSSGFIVYNTQGGVFGIHTVDGSSQSEGDRTLSGLDRYLFGNRFFHGNHFEGGVLQVIPQQLFQVGDDYFGVDKLYAIVFRLFVCRNFEKLLLESEVNIVLEFDFVAQQAFQIFFLYHFPVGGQVCIS